MRSKPLRPVHPNAGIEADYRRRVAALVADMARSYEHWIKAQYRETPPRLAMDATPARELRRELNQLGRRWERRIDEGAPRLAQWFAKSASRRSEARLKQILRDAGMSVRFKMTPTMRDAYEATIEENVGLIRSIAQKYHSDVEGLVMRSVTAGRDLGSLASELERRYRLTRKRAALISRDQNNKATSVFVRVRQQELGLKAVWLHSHGGKEPRPTHLANSGKTYDPAVGWFDPDPKVRDYIWPGTLINCRCVSRSVIEGFS